MLGAIIPLNILRSNLLSDKEKVFIAELSIKESPYNGDFKEFECLLGVSIASIKNYVRNCLKHGFLTHNDDNGFYIMTNVYDESFCLEVKPVKKESFIAPSKDELEQIWNDLISNADKYNDNDETPFIVKYEFNSWYEYWNSVGWKRKNGYVKNFKQTMRSSFNYTNVIKHLNKPIFDFKKKSVDNSNSIDYNNLSVPELFVEIKKEFKGINVAVAYNSAMKGVKVGSYIAYPAKDNNHVIAIIKNYMKQDAILLKKTGIL